MLICLMRAVAGQTASAPGQPSGTVIETAELTIGSAPNQQLQVPHADVDPQHAILRKTASGRLLLTALGSRGVLVNGRRHLRVLIDSNDLIQLGDTIVRLQVPGGAAGEYACTLRIEDPYETDEAAPISAVNAQAQGPRLTIGFWSWTLTLGVAAIFLLVPLGTFLTPSVRKLLRTAPLVPSDALWSSGPLHASHRFIGSNCTACHVKPFERVRNTECEHCHADTQHHVDARSSDVALFAQQRCAECHFEHKEPSALIVHDRRLCTDCHARMDRLKSQPLVANATDFGSDHPAFRLAVLRQDSIIAPGQWQAQWLDPADPAHFKENSHLKFSHAQHLDPKGIHSPTGERILRCADCHRPDSSGREMLPIRMETQCSGCHSLRFDEHDPGSGVPHGDLTLMFRALREHFSRQYLEADNAATRNTGGLRRPGQEARRMSLEEQRRARDWADTQSLAMAQELLEKRVCADCHDVSRKLGESGFDQWQISPVRLTQSWMPRARFNHAAHLAEPCTSCHDGAEHSQRSSDILMPKIEKCRQCHGDAGDASKLNSDCVMCHRFHLPSRGRFDQPHARPAK